MPTSLAALIAYINQYIFANNRGAITGPILAMVLVAMATYFGTYYTPSTFIALGGTSAVNILTRFGYQLTPQDFGATGNTATVPGTCSVAQGSTAWSCPGSSFVSTDVGKYALIHGAGASGAALQTTITGVTDATHITVAAAATTAATNVANNIYGTDDTAAVAAAIGATSATNACLNFPAGTYWLASSSTTIPLAHACLKGAGAVEFQQPYTQTGSSLFISNTTTSQFTVGVAVNINNITVFYPGQDGYSATPITYPALFEAASSGMGNTNFDNLVLVNPYTMIYSSASDGTLGRVFLHGVHAYCIKYCFDMLNGAADLISIDSTSMFSPGWYQDVAVFGTTPPAGKNSISFFGNPTVLSA